MYWFKAYVHFCSVYAITIIGNLVKSQGETLVHLQAFFIFVYAHFTEQTFPRKTLHSIITRLGVDHLISRMARVRDDDRFRHVSPESIVLPLPPQLIMTNAMTEGEIWLDWGFIEFWKANYCT